MGPPSANQPAQPTNQPRPQASRPAQPTSQPREGGGGSAERRVDGAGLAAAVAKSRQPHGPSAYDIGSRVGPNQPTSATNQPASTKGQPTNQPTVAPNQPTSATNPSTAGAERLCRKAFQDIKLAWRWRRRIFSASRTARRLMRYFPERGPLDPL